MTDLQRLVPFTVLNELCVYACIIILLSGAVRYIDTYWDWCKKYSKNTGYIIINKTRWVFEKQEVCRFRDVPSRLLLERRAFQGIVRWHPQESPRDCEAVGLFVDDWLLKSDIGLGDRQVALRVFVLLCEADAVRVASMPTGIRLYREAH